MGGTVHGTRSVDKILNLGCCVLKKISYYYNRFKTYLHNSAWIMGERILAIVLGFFVTVFVARYLGPEEYGVLSYAISIVALFAAAGHMGLSGLVVRQILN